jgi:hypothetical protein
MDQALPDEAAAECAKVEIASVVAEARDDSIEGRPRRYAQDGAQPALRAHVAGREHVEPSEPA